MGQGPAESGFTTSEFAASVVAAACVLLAPIAHIEVNAGEQAALVTLIAVFYTLARSLRKQGTPG